MRAPSDAVRDASDEPDDTARVPSAPSIDAELEPPMSGQRLGRYVVIDELGRGAMGVVVRAYDPKLQREVALKRIRSQALGQAAPTKLMREAQAMAKLSHPNVVAIYDVELDGDAVVLAMEYVAGPTLRTWLKKRPPWPTIVSTFVAAGRGLAAAHRVGLLHRDFKPANVLIGPDGLAKVTDFGLARPVASLEDRGSSVSGSLSGGSLSGDGWAVRSDPSMHSIPGGGTNSLMTAEGTIVGTPVYMAPEQHGNTSGLTAAADQFAFCVSLWQGLTGTAPYRSDIGLRGLGEHKRAGPPAWPREVAVPRRIVEAIRRGLAPDPRDRWPSVDHLLTELEHRSRHRSRAVMLAVGATATVGGLGIGLASQSNPAPCSGASEHIEPIWGSEAKARAERAFSAVRGPHVQGAWQRVSTELDRFAIAWTDMHRDACEATAVRKEQSAEVMDLRMACLGRMKTELAATVEVLARADTDVVEHADRLVSALPSIEHCADLQAVRGETAALVAPEDRAAFDRVREALARARARSEAGQYDAAAEAVLGATELVESLEIEALWVEWAQTRGEIAALQGHYDEAETWLRSAYRRSLQAKQWDVARRSARRLAFVTGDALVRFGEGLTLADTALGLTPLGDGQEEARTRAVMARILERQGRLVDAESEARQALTLQSGRLDPDHPDLAEAHDTLGQILRAAGRYREAADEHRRAIEIWTRRLGAEHPLVANGYNGLAWVFQEEGRLEDARTQLEAAQALLTAAHGPDHPDTTAVATNLGNTLAMLGRFDEAERMFREQLEIAVAKFGPRHPRIAKLHNNIANTLWSRGRYPEAETEHRLALDIRVAALGPDHADVADSYNNLGHVYKYMGRYDDGLEHLEKALEIRRKTLGPDHPRVAESLANIADVFTMQGRLDAAQVHLEQAIALQERVVEPDHPDLARSRASLGVVLAERGDHAGAVARFTAALDVWDDSLPLEHPQRALLEIELGLALTELAGGEAPPRAVEHLERALSAEHDADIDGPRWAEARFVLGRALWKANERARARAQVEAALATPGEGLEPLRTRIRAWLRQHP